MKIYVQGLWHLGIVSAACLASLGHDVIGFDRNQETIELLNDGKSIIFEPGLEKLIQDGIKTKKLTFTSTVNDIDFLWITYDTPVNDNDEADVNFVIEQILETLPFVNNDAIILISSQMPIGSVANLEKIAKKLYPSKNINFAYLPENLRLGNALKVFLDPDRIIVGVRTDNDKKVINKILATITHKIEWMSVESAEMTKHAINSFLATSIVFANEIASICEITGANAKEVERGLKSESRIGYKAYVSPGVAFSGGTLARDIGFLQDVSEKHHLCVPLLKSVKISNDMHKLWIRRKIQQFFPNLHNINITVWGITYKTGTDTLRRSLSVELCNWLIEQNTNLTVYDPLVREFPQEWNGIVKKSNDLSQSLKETKLLIINTKSDTYEEFFQYYNANNLTVIDPNRFVSFLEKNKEYNYISVGLS